MGKWIGAIVNILEEHIMNPLGISWEHIGNKKVQKIKQALTLPRRILFWMYWVHATIFHWLSIISIPNYVFHLFQT
jgi:hypothetical protein